MCAHFAIIIIIIVCYSPKHCFRLIEGQQSASWRINFVRFRCGDRIRTRDSSDRPNVRFGRTVRPNFYCAVWPKWQNFFLQNTELRQPLIFLFCLMTHMYTSLFWSLGKIAKRMPKLELNYHINLRLIVCLLDLQFRSRFLSAFYMFRSVRFSFGKQNFDWQLFGSGRTVKHWSVSH